MKKDFKKFLYAVLMLSLLFLIGTFCSVADHEGLHQRVFANYGISSHWTFAYRPSELLSRTIAYTYPDNRTLADINCNESCIKENDLIDIIGYHFGGLEGVLFFLALFFLCYKYFIEEKDFLIKDELIDDSKYI